MEEDRYARMTLRLPKTLYSQLQKAANDTSKSTNAEIVARLEQSFAARDTSFTPSTLVVLSGLQYQLATLSLKIHDMEVDRQKLIDPLREAVELLEKHNLSSQVYDLRSLETLANESVYSEKYLRERTKELKDELFKAEQTLREKAQAMIDDAPGLHTP